MTFRIECFIEDKSLGEVLHALARLKGVEMPNSPQPVINREKGGKAIVGSKLEAAYAILDKMPTPFTVQEFKAQLVAIGTPVGSANSYLQRWKKEKRIKLKERGVWMKQPRKVA